MDDGDWSTKPHAARDFSLASIEDLDPEPPGHAARIHRRELILGLLLVCALVGFGGWQWWDQGGKLGYYHAGQRAAAAHDWEAARTAYVAAGDYSDARSRAAEAATLITQRQEQSQLALAAAARGEWPAALAAAQQVLSIVPDDPRISPVARAAAAQVYAQALSGTVALRTKGTPPGLYYYGPAGWRQLASSDARSRVRGACPDGAPIYDAPDPNAPPRVPGQSLDSPPTGNAGQRGGFSQNLAGRRLVIGTPGGPVRVVLAFDPTQYYRFLCTDTGVWGFRFGNGVSQPTTVIEAPTLAVDYQAFVTGKVSTPILPDSSWSLVAVAPDGRHIILLRQIIEQMPMGWFHQLAVATPDGRIVQTLPRGNGSLAGVDVSPDGRSLLLTVELPIAGALYQAAEWVNLDGDGAEISLAGNYQQPGRTSSAFNLPPLFIPAGPAAGQILLTNWHQPPAALPPGSVTAQGQRFVLDARDHVRLVDPAHPDQSLLTLDVDTLSTGSHFIRQDQATGALLVGWPNTIQAPGAGSTIAIIDPTGHVRQVNPPLPAWDDLSNAWLRAGRLVYASLSAAGAGGDPVYTLRSLPLAPGTSGPAVTVYTSTIPMRPFRQSTNTAQRLGPGLLAYVTASGELHARTYDGATDVLLESGVGALYELTADLTLGSPTFAGLAGRSTR